MEHLRTIRDFRRETQQVARCRRNKAKPFKERTARNGANGFLNHTFQPFWLFDGNSVKAEEQFFRSLTNLCDHYDLLLPDVSAWAFPQNIYKAWQVTAERVEAIDKKLDCIIIQDESHDAALATISNFNTGRTLYYIPVKPLWKWVNEPAHKAVAEVVSGIFAYLFQVVQVPMYTEYESFIGQQYRYMEDMINDETAEDEEAEGYRQEQLNELYALQNSGLHLQRLMNDKTRLETFADTVLNYANAEQRDNDLAILAIEFVQLYRAYPNSSYFDKIRPDLYYPEVEERIRAEDYISFYWSGNDTLTDELMEIINCSFQEMGITDEPIDVKLFDSSLNSETECFGFESRFFPLLERLAEFLEDYDH